MKNKSSATIDFASSFIPTQQGALNMQKITAIGANGHNCDLSGTIHKGQAVLEDGEDGKPCIVTFEPTKKGIHITDNDGACRSYCGARAGFTDLYLKPQPGCEATSIQKARTEFKRLYDRKAYAQARAKLEPVLKNCILRLRSFIDYCQNALSRIRLQKQFHADNFGYNPIKIRLIHRTI